MKIPIACHLTMLYHPYFAGRAAYLRNTVFKQFQKISGKRNIVITGNFDDLKPYEVSKCEEIYRVALRKNSKKTLLYFAIKSVKYLFLLRKRYQIIHLHGMWDVYLIISIFAKIFKKKVITHMSLLGSDDPLAIKKSYKLMAIRMKIMSLIDYFIAISTPMVESYYNCKLSKEKIILIPNGVDLEKYCPTEKETKNKIRKILNLVENNIVVIFVGAIIKRKGVDLIIDAWKNLQNNFCNIQLILVGPYEFEGFEGDENSHNKYLKNLKTAIEENHLNVKFIGRSDKVELFMKASDIFILPSKEEGFGNVIVEAMASGLPVIISELQGISSDLISNNIEGFIATNSDEIEKCIKYLIENPKERERLGRNARIKAENKFAIQKICLNYINLYDRVTSTSGTWRKTPVS